MNPAEQSRQHRELICIVVKRCLLEKNLSLHIEIRELTLELAAGNLTEGARAEKAISVYTKEVELVLLHQALRFIDRLDNSRESRTSRRSSSSPRH